MYKISNVELALNSLSNSLYDIYDVNFWIDFRYIFKNSLNHDQTYVGMLVILTTRLSVHGTREVSIMSVSTLLLQVLLLKRDCKDPRGQLYIPLVLGVPKKTGPVPSLVSQVLYNIATWNLVEILLNKCSWEIAHGSLHMGHLKKSRIFMI